MKLNNQTYAVIEIRGRIDKTPTVNTIGGDKFVTTINIAVNRSKKLEDGSYQNTAQWYPVSCWNELATQAKSICDKGALVCVKARVNLEKKCFVGSDNDKQYFNHATFTAQEIERIEAVLESDSGEG